MLSGTGDEMELFSVIKNAFWNQDVAVLNSKALFGLDSFCTRRWSNVCIARVAGLVNGLNGVLPPDQ